MPGPVEASNGYESCAEEFITARDTFIGVGLVRDWVRRLPRRACVLDLGCGHGVPVTQALVEEGARVYGVDASPSLVIAFHRRFPGCPVACEPAEESDFFGRTFDGVIASGLMFLLHPGAQALLIRRAATALVPGGSFLFTAPAQVATWADVLTGRTSTSLGAEAYRAALAGAGLALVAEHDDEGGNHYYEARASRRSSAA